MSIIVKGSSMAVLSSRRMPVRERIIPAADALFRNHGFRRVTVDMIAERANTTKMAVYRHFESKDALVLEWLDREIASYSSVLDRLALALPGAPLAQLEGWVSAIADGLPGLSHRGCPFVNSLAELPEADDPARQRIETHKARQAQRILDLCQRAGLPEPELACAQIVFLTEGAQVTAQNGSLPRIAASLKAAAKSVLQPRR